MDVVVRADQPVKVTGAGEDRVLAAGQSETFTGVTGNLSVAEAKPEELPPPASTDADVFSAANRPNGPMTAGIAPKMPKSGGETAQVLENDTVVERPVAELGRATQGGGPDAEIGGGALKTPGPQPGAEPGVMAAPQLGAATGDAKGGRPTERTEASVQSGSKKSGAKKSGQKASSRKSR